MVELYRRKCELLNRMEIGNTHLVLVEGIAPKTGKILGRNEFYLKVLFDQGEIPSRDSKRDVKPGDYVSVRITGAKASALTGEALCHTGIREFYRDTTWADRCLK